MTRKRVNTKSSNIYSNVCPKFPPNINVPQCIEESVKKYQEGETRRTPNAFLLYRSQYIAEFSRVNNCNLAATKISPLARQSWYNEPTAVQNHYKDLAIKIKEGVRKRIPFSFVNKQKNLSPILDDVTVGVTQTKINPYHTVDPAPIVDSNRNAEHAHNLPQLSAEIVENAHNLSQFDTEITQNTQNLSIMDSNNDINAIQETNFVDFLPYVNELQFYPSNNYYIPPIPYDYGLSFYMPQPNYDIPLEYNPSFLSYSQ
ncbi:9736_t:CDS:1 [Racocetra fulgida]|uniref:9736_t:CDS:1 n=1 Tax=Racocetra fulgida TaxID=60492 RepID=A0A9N9DGQ7_9GLOM|nr:9736_t:CDS:1 [Racocetra fulgida]